VTLGFIGVRLVLHALHVTEVPFLHGGRPMLWASEIPIWFSLLFIAGTITIATIASLLKTRNEGPEQPVRSPSLEGASEDR
jgi:tellurite resistance protein TerC